MRNLLMAYALLLPALLAAQKIENKNGVIQVDGKDLAKITIVKKNFGLTKDFEVSSLSGRKLIIAVPATGFTDNKDDNSTLYYRLTFLTSGQVGIFSFSSLGQEKSFLKLIGNSDIFEGDSTSNAKVMELIAAKGVSPTVAINYTLVSRSRSPWPVRILLEERKFEQDNKIIGTYQLISNVNDLLTYEFRLPSGVLVARAAFTGGHNALNVDLFTAKDNYRRTQPFPPQDKISAGGDPGWKTVEKVGKWLTENNYL